MLDTVGSLVVLQQGSHDAGKGQCATVQCVAELCLAVRITITALEPVGLVALEVGYGTHLQPALLCCGVYLEIEGECRSEAHVTTTKTQDAPGQQPSLSTSVCT